MSTDVTMPAPSPASAPARRRPSLLAAEVLRLTRRRMIHILLVLAAVGFVVVAGITSTQFGEPSAAQIDQAEQTMAQDMAATEQYYTECTDGLSDGDDAELMCGPEPSEQETELDWYLPVQPFTAELALLGATATALGTAAVLFLVGATSIGADWSSRALIASLFWEPRRLRVLGARGTVLVGLGLVVGVLAQAAWTAVALFLTSTSGQQVGGDFWGDLLGVQARAVLLGVLIALLGLGVANLVRGTGAALGIGFFYFVIVENVVRFVWEPGQEWLLSTNAFALVTRGGTVVSWFEEELGTGEENGGRFVEVVVDNLQGGIVVAIYVAVVLVAGTALFRLRDLH